MHILCKNWFYKTCTDVTSKEFETVEEEKSNRNTTHAKV